MSFLDQKYYQKATELLHENHMSCVYALEKEYKKEKSSRVSVKIHTCRGSQHPFLEAPLLV